MPVILRVHHLRTRPFKAVDRPLPVGRESHLRLGVLGESGRHPEGEQCAENECGLQRVNEVFHGIGGGALKKIAQSNPP